MVSRKEILEEARGWLDVPWAHQGRTMAGIDCVGLPIMVAQKLGLTDYNPTDYPRRPDNTFLGHFQKVLKSKPILQAKEGDVLVFASGTHLCHCGIKSTRHRLPAVIHAHAKRRKVVEELLEDARSIVGKPIYCFEFPEVEDD